MYISSRFFENQPNEICSHLSKRGVKRQVSYAKEAPSHSNEGKGKEKRKEAMIAPLVSIMATLVLDAKGPMGDNVIKKPARY